MVQRILQRFKRKNEKIAIHIVVFDGDDRVEKYAAITDYLWSSVGLILFNSRTNARSL